MVPDLQMGTVAVYGVALVVCPTPSYPPTGVLSSALWVPQNNADFSQYTAVLSLKLR